MARPDSEETASEKPAEIDATGKTLVATIDSTGSRSPAEKQRFAEGSQESSSDEALAEAATLATGSGPGGSGHSRLQEGGKLGRLEIGKVLGDGAFGEVVSAYDPKLKRKLAVKVLKAEVFSSAGGQEAQARLLREARAMARIEHPNVVTVHDIGTVEGQVFVAMQFVEGNLRTWLAEADRSWAEIVEKFVQAGRGLAAAHAVGLVHRDFKPDNVLVGKSGEVRVADFGLVSISESGPEQIASTEFATGPQSSDDLEITRAGAMMGTALYMAPEQHLGEEATAASDQFAFCVALYWSLYCAQPFDGKDYAALRKNVLAGQRKPTPTTVSVPRWLDRALSKGMSRRPEDRHASMQSLLAILERDRRSLRRRRLAAGALVIGGAALASFLWAQSGSDNPCNNQGRKLVGVWDAPIRQAMAKSFAATGREASFAGLGKTIDGYTRDWVSVRTRVCEATHLFGAQSDRLLDQRMLCLDQRLNYLRSFLSQLQAGADAQTLDAALRVASDLPGLDRCTGSQVAGANLELPEDPDERDRAFQLDAIVDKAQALADLGKKEQAMSLLEANMDGSVHYEPTLARALALRGKTRVDLGEFDAGEDDLRASIEHATAAGDDAEVASSWLALMHLSGVEREDYQTGHQMGELARLAMVRGKAGELAMASIDKATASVLLREGKNAEAVARLQAALPVFQEKAPPVELARLLASLGDGMVGDLKYQEAVDYYRLALATLEASLGEEHPENIYVLNNLSIALKGLGEIAEARQVLEASARAVERSYGPESRELVTVLNNLGNILRREGDTAAATKTFERAIAIGKVSLDAGHPTVTKAIMNLGIVYATEGKHAQATATFREVLERTEASFSEDHPDWAMALNNLAEALLLEEKFAEALPYAQAAADMKGRLYGVDHPRQSSSVATLAAAYLGLGKTAEAADLYHRALASYREAVGDAHPLTVAIFSALGRLYEGSGAARKAMPLLQKAVEGRGADDSSSENTEDKRALARAYQALGKGREAEQLLEQLARPEGESTQHP